VVASPHSFFQVSFSGGGAGVRWALDLREKVEAVLSQV
jgi:hypothetical protein